MTVSDKVCVIVIWYSTVRHNAIQHVLIHLVIKHPETLRQITHCNIFILLFVFKSLVSVGFLQINIYIQ